MKVPIEWLSPIAVLMLALCLCACAGHGVEVRARGEMDFGVSVGGKM